MKGPNSIEIEASEQTPFVLLDREKGIFRIEGFSYPESPYVFYTSIVEWFKEYCQSPNGETHISFAFLYVNSTSIKFINDILKLLDGLTSSGKKARVSWFMSPGDEDIEQLGMELQGLHKLPFDIIIKEKEQPPPPKKFF